MLKDHKRVSKCATFPHRRSYCSDYGGSKLCFESRQSAERFMQHNSEQILAENGYAPVRAYYCKSCSCWHITSQPASERATAFAKARGKKGIREHIPATADFRRKSRKLKKQLEVCLKDAFMAIKYQDLGLAKHLCKEGIELYGRCSEMAISGRVKKQLLNRLTYCVNRWQAMRDELWSRLFKVEYRPATLLYCQWYMSAS